MIKKIKNIFKLTKIFFKNSFQNPYLIDEKTNKINKKSIFVWLLLINTIAVSYLSFEVIRALVNVNLAPLFLNVFFIITMVIIIFQAILATSNVYFFSKDFEQILPLPIKANELLISKFCTVLINIYFMEFIFALVPLIIYGILTYAGFLYYFYLIIILIIFPILPVLIISIFMMLVMKMSKFIKNKDVFQIIITLFMLFLMFFVEVKMSNNLIKKIDNNSDINTQENVQEINNFHERFKNINKYFLEIEPSINLLTNYNKLNSILNLIKIILYNFIFLILFDFIGKKYYLKNILKNNNYYKKIKNKKIKNKRIKKISKRKAYIEKEFKNLFKNPTFFMQCIFPIIIIMVSFFILMLTVTPNIRALLTSDIFGEDMQLSVDFNVICLIIGIIQIISTTLNISISSTSREGQSAYYMKVIPIDFYKQIIYKSVPQIIISNILNLIILIFIKLIFNDFNYIYLILIFIISILLNIINSILMVVVDLYKPNLNWKVDYEAIKQNNNKLFQYALTIIIILLLIYFNKICINLNIYISCSLLILILFILILIINKIIKINANKLFKKIN